MDRTRIVAPLVVVALAGTAAAQSLSCGFDSPFFSPGALNNQNGWIVSPADVPAAAARVVTAPRRAGDHAVRFDQSQYDSEFSATWPCGVQLSPNQHVMDAEWDMYTQFGSGYGWIIDLRASNNVRLGMLWLSGPNVLYNIWARDPQWADGTIHHGQWARLKVRMDWQARTTEFFLNGQSIALGGWRADPTTTLATIQFSALIGGSTDVAGIDSISVTPTTICTADFNGDGALDSQDYFDFLDTFLVGGPADFNLDGELDSQDFFSFLEAFFAGC